MRTVPIALCAVILCGCSLDDFRRKDLRSDSGSEFAPELGVDLETMTRTSSGLYWKTTREGNGRPAEAGDTVSMAYSGWLTNGTLFDRAPAESPYSFVLGYREVIGGWDEGVAGMRPGERRRLVIPPSLGYGETGSGPIPPNATLVFDVERVASSE
ncbi:MAG: FKBP-type peptidyl-prolyl cis-trans isomerase [Gemmatimonadales bacterium]